jgi:hypothetical protein
MQFPSSIPIAHDRVTLFCLLPALTIGVGFVCVVNAPEKTHPVNANGVVGGYVLGEPMKFHIFSLFPEKIQ